MKIEQTFTSRFTPASGPAGSFEILSGENGYSVRDKRSGKFLVENASSESAYTVARTAVEIFDKSMSQPVMLTVWGVWQIDGGGVGIKQKLKGIYRAKPEISGYEMCEERRAVVLDDMVYLLDSTVSPIPADKLDADLIKTEQDEIDAAIAKLTPREIALLKNGHAFRNI